MEAFYEWFRQFYEATGWNLVFIYDEYERDPGRGLLIKGDRALTWKQVRAVMDKINENGMSTMLLAVQKEEE